VSPSTPDPKGSPTVVLCGSVTHAVAALDATERHYLDLGYRVHKPVKDDSRTPQEHAERWYALIDACGPDDVVVACTMQHADLGAAVRREIGDALHLGKRVRLWVEAIPTDRVTCPWCERPDRKLTPKGRIRHHVANPGAPVWNSVACQGTGQRPDEYREERAS
jgi:hypothetical protein